MEQESVDNTLPSPSKPLTSIQEYFNNGDKNLQLGHFFKKHSWDKEGRKILDEINKRCLTKKDKLLFKYLLTYPIPKGYRAKLWYVASGAKREYYNNMNYYEQILENYPKDAPNPYEKIINMDIIRTYQDNIKDEKRLNRLRNVLLAYSRRNTSIGYCQGFNFLAARILSEIDNEEKAFWVFVQLLENVLPINYYSEMAGVMIDSTILNKLIMHYIPDFFAFLKDKECELYLSNFVFKWLISIYTQGVTSEFSTMIWDLLFLEGDKILFKAGLGILNILKGEIMKRKQSEEIYEILENPDEFFKGNTEIFYQLLIMKHEFNSKYIKNNRLNLEKTIYEKIVKDMRKNIECNKKFNRLDEEREREKKKRGKNDKIKNEETKGEVEKHGIDKTKDHHLIDEGNENIDNGDFNEIPCNLSWPICIHDEGNENLISSIVLRVGEDVNFIPDYFFRISTKNNNGMTEMKSFIDKSLTNLKPDSKDFLKKSSKVKVREVDFPSIELVERKSSDRDIDKHCGNEDKLDFRQEIEKVRSEIKVDMFNFDQKMEKDLLIERREHKCAETHECLSKSILEISTVSSIDSSIMYLSGKNKLKKTQSKCFNYLKYYVNGVSKNLTKSSEYLNLVSLPKRKSIVERADSYSSFSNRWKKKNESSIAQEGDFPRDEETNEILLDTREKSEKFVNPPKDQKDPSKRKGSTTSNSTSAAKKNNSTKVISKVDI